MEWTDEGEFHKSEAGVVALINGEWLGRITGIEDVAFGPCPDLETIKEEVEHAYALYQGEDPPPIKQRKAAQWQ